MDHWVKVANKNNGMFNIFQLSHASARALRSQAQPRART